MERRAILNLLVLTATIILGVTTGYPQELTVQVNNNGVSTNYTFNTDVPDSSIYNIEFVELFCGSGLWILYDDYGYENELAMWASHNDQQVVCSATPPFKGLPKSFRYGGGFNTEYNHISLFSEENFGGYETELDESIDGLLGDVKSVIFTGDCKWQLCQDEAFGGHCEITYGLPDPEFPGIEIGVYANLSLDLGLDRVRSVGLVCP